MNCPIVGELGFCLHLLTRGLGLLACLKMALRIGPPFKV